MSEAPFLTPSVTALLAQVNAGPAPDPSPAGQRAALNGAMAALGWPAAAATHVLPLDSGASVHLFAPTGEARDRPLIVYLHGGSFLAGGAQAHGGLAAAMAQRSGAMVALIDYRLTPEHPLPAALVDADVAIAALAGAAERQGFRMAPLTIVGDSAGGWLAAMLALRLGQAGVATASRLVLINPMITPRPARTASRDEFAAGYFAGTADFVEAWRLAGNWAAGTVHPGDDPAALAGLPPTFILTNEADPVRDEAEAFAEALAAAGVPVVNLRARGVIHAAWLFPTVLPEAELLLDVIVGVASDRGHSRRSP